MTPKRIVIVGGGTAGWLAAMMLSDVSARKGWEASVTVVESSRIGTIGVGEGSTAVFRQMLAHFRLSEEEFLRETGATIKYGIRHRDWRRVGHHYDGPIDDPALVSGGLPLDLYAVAAGRRVSEAHLFQQLMTKARAPVALQGGRRIPAGPYHHAFHFDQALVGAWLRRKAPGIAVIDDEVAGIETGSGVETGAAGIAALRMVSGRRVEGDFFIDASGFRRALITGLGGAWLSYSDVLPVNRAMPFWVDLKEGEEIPPMTVAWAQKNGWLWQIPTQERFGMGYVYSDAHISPEAAQAEIEAALGHKIEPRRDIKIDAGRLRAPWIGNCVALGLASSFLEPLEATSIHGTITQLMMLSEWLPLPDGAARYNAAVSAQVDDFRDFIRLHYVTERRDSAFWRDVSGSLPEALAERLALWATRLPRPGDFARFPLGLPHLQGQLYVPVLDGLGLLSQSAARAEMTDARLRERTRATHAGLVSEYARAADQCLPHRAWLDSLRETVG